MNQHRLTIFFSAEFEYLVQSAKIKCTQKTTCFRYLEHLVQLVQIRKVKIKRRIYRAQIKKKIWDVRKNCTKRTNCSVTDFLKGVKL